MFSSGASSVNSVISHQSSSLDAWSPNGAEYHDDDADAEEVASDLIVLLSTVQKCGVDFLPIHWQSGTIGSGATANISQSTLDTETALVFKRFRIDETNAIFKPMIRELLIVNHPPFRNHPNIVNLEGVCWEVSAELEGYVAVPVLVFEKAGWDLEQFVAAGKELLFDTRLDVCAGIGNAIMALHTYGVIHGDIKPKNVLVFEDSVTKKISVKICDFGFSSIVAGQKGPGEVFVPKSRPWNAPEHVFGDVGAVVAQRMDVYSFGLLCLWVLFNDRLSEVSGINTDGVSEQISFGGPFLPMSQTLLERLKYEDQMVNVANKLIAATWGLSEEQKVRLTKFFSLTLTLNAEDRNVDFGVLIGHLGGERIELQSSLRNQLKGTDLKELLLQEPFRVAPYLDDFVQTDYVVCSQICKSLEKNYYDNRSQPFAPNIAFQLAFCYCIGFGARADVNKSQEWLERAHKHRDDLEAEKLAVQPSVWKNERMKTLRRNGILYRMDLREQYQSRGYKKLAEIAKEYEKEIHDSVAVFRSEIHFVPLALARILGEVLDALGKPQEAKALRGRLRNQLEKTHGKGHPHHELMCEQVAVSNLALGELKEYLEYTEERVKIARKRYHPKDPRLTLDLSHLATAYQRQGRWADAVELQKQAMAIRKEVLGEMHPDTISIMVDISTAYWHQGKWEKAKTLQEQALKMCLPVFGEKHTVTLDVMGRLALTHADQGQYHEAEKLCSDASRIAKTVYGCEHPNAISATANLATIYAKQGRMEEAEDLQVHVLQTSKRMFGEANPITLTRIGNLASTYSGQGKYSEAMKLCMSATEKSLAVLGGEHPDTLARMSGLASAYSDLGRWEEAEKLGTQVLDTRRKILGPDHPETLSSMAKLASTYWSLGRWKEAHKLQAQAMKSRQIILGPEHPETLSSMAAVVAEYWSQGKSAEAEELLISVIDARQRVIGEDHPDTLASIATLARIYSNRGRFVDAEKLFEKVLKRRQRTSDPDRPDTLSYMAGLASTYSGRGDYKKAEALLKKIMETTTDKSGLNHPDTRSIMRQLAMSYMDLGQYKKAEELLLQVLGMIRYLGIGHPETRLITANLSMNYRNQGRLKEARELQLQVMNANVRNPGEEHPDSLTSVANLLSCIDSIRLR